MMGSGIYSDWVSISIDCPECKYAWDEELHTDDWGRIDTDTVCPKCSEPIWVRKEKGDY